jgi:hypothetical protein
LRIGLHHLRMKPYFFAQILRNTAIIWHYDYIFYYRWDISIIKIF